MCVRVGESARLESGGAVAYSVEMGVRGIGSLMEPRGESWTWRGRQMVLERGWELGAKRSGPESVGPEGAVEWELEGLGFDSLIGESWTKRGRQMDLWRGLGGRRQEHDTHWVMEGPEG